MINKKINKIIEEIEKVNKLIENKKNLNLKNITKLCKQYNEIILKLENNNFIMINELERISFEKNIEKENTMLLDKYAQLIYVKNKLLIMLLKKEYNEYLKEKNNQLKEKLEQLIEDEKSYLFELNEENENLKEVKYELKYLEEQINNDNLNEENIKNKQIYEKKEKEIKESIELLDVSILIVRVEIKYLKTQIEYLTK